MPLWIDLTGKRYGGPVDLYSSYLSSNTYQQYNQYCTKSYGQKPQITAKDLDQAFNYAFNEVKGYASTELNIGKQGIYYYQILSRDLSFIL